MRLQIMSDLHLINWGKEAADTFAKETQTDADALILAGDIVSLTMRHWRWSMARLQEFVARYKHVIYVPGNHEFYGGSIDEVDLDVVAQQTGVDVLYPGRFIEIDGQRFLGATMWQPHHGEWVDNLRTTPWEDFSDSWCIEDSAEEAPRHFAEFKAFLERALRPGDIVVTHHAPSMMSIDAQWAGHPSNRWFATPEVEPLILERKPKLWIHGHMHTPFRYKLGETEVICNPRGYPTEGVRFNPQLVVEVP